MGCIYCIENKTNNKKYIGKTIYYSRRMTEHKSEAFNSNRLSYNYPIHKAMRKYGIDNFNYLILEDNIDEMEKLDEKEKYYIQKYNTTNKENGYNICEGGQGGVIKNRQIIVHQYSLNGEYLNSYKSIRNAEQKTGIDHSQIIRCCKMRNRLAGNYQWSYERFKSVPPVRNKVNSTRIKQFTIFGEYITTYDSIIEATKKTGLKSRNSISNVLYGIQSTAGGYYWELE